MDSDGSKWERELNYYRRECNDLGARLLRLQEEQSQAFREARRSRTVVKLLRETYRLGDFASTTQDVGGAMLELVVDNALCDRAALLREETPGSGKFLMVHAIGLPESALSEIMQLTDPPAFFFTSGQNTPNRCADQVVATMGVPYVLWSYDRGSGHSLVIGNRFESNINRPFEPGDQELIEGALSVYLDVLYRKHAEAQLRQAKQAAEAARDTRAAFLRNLAGELQESIDCLLGLFDRSGQGRDRAFGSIALRDKGNEAIRLVNHVQHLIQEARRRETGPEVCPPMDVEWLAVDEVIRGALRSAYIASIKSGVEIDCRLPNRRCAILADRARMSHVIDHLVSSAVRATPTGGTVRVAATRRSDGGLEILFSSRGAGLLTVAHPMPESSMDAAAWDDVGSLDTVRQTIDAHEGALVVESSAFAGTNIRVILPAQCTRDVAISSMDDA